MSEYVRHNMFFSSGPVLTSVIKEFLEVTLPKITGSLVSRITEKFNVFKSESSS